MENLLRCWNDLAPGWSGKDVMLLLDYDGTLAPIALTPALASLPQENRHLLERLITLPHCHVAIISGRALADVKSMVRVPGLIYVGNHGWEIDGPKARFNVFSYSPFRKELENIRDALAPPLASIKGVWIEDKGITLSIHYRLVEKGQAILVRQILKNVCRDRGLHNRVKIHAGKKVLEVKPPVDWDKEQAAGWIIKRYENGRPVVPIYIGDDIMHQNTFASIKHKGVTVFVGADSASPAQFYLESPAAVTEFLKCLARWLENRKDA